MAILTHGDIAKINAEMIGRGRPNQKDDVGYNRVDYNTMELIGMLNSELTLEESVVSLEAMKKYTNTQLQEYKDDIYESLEYYNRAMDEKYGQLSNDSDTALMYQNIAKQKAINGSERTIDDYESREINYFGIENDKVKMSFKEFIEGLDLRPFNGRWGCINKSGEKVKGGFTIPVRNIDEFLEYAKDLGKIGYQASKEMKEDLDKVKSKQTELSYYGIKNGMALVSFKEESMKDFAIADYEGKWFKSTKMSFNVMGIPTKNLSRFLNDVQQKYNYVAPVKLKEDLQSLPKEQTTPVQVSSQYKLTATGKVNAKYGFDIFHLNTSTPMLKQGLWNLKNTAIKYVQENDDGTLEISTTKDMLPALVNYLKPRGIDTYDAEHFRELRNKSGNTLKDVSHSDLPFNPYEFQVEDAKKIVGMKRALIGHDMGCGKTLIATMVGESLKDERKLVVCPESLRLNWEKEIKQFNKDADVNIIYSNTKQVDLTHDWTIMGFATVRKFAPLIINSSDINCMFVDESHNCKAVDNGGKPKSQVAQSVLAISDKVDYCYPMTGTPMPTRTKDLYNTFRMLKEFSDNRGFFKFGQKYCGAYNNGFGWDYSGSSNEQELSSLLNEYMIRRTKKEVLPNLQKQRIFIPLESSLMSREVKQNEKDLHCPNDEQTFMGLAMSGRNLLSQCKIKSAIELAETHLNAEESVVIVSEFNETLDKLQEKFGDDACCIRGGMSDKAKQQAIDDFQSGKKSVCLLNMKAGGVGITLTKAHTMIMCDYDWTPANMTQVEDRICRTGQEHLCNIEYLHFPNSTLDNVFIEMITNKSEIIDKVVDDAENSVDLHNARNSNSTFIDNLKAKIEAEGGGKAKKTTRKPRKKKADKEETKVTEVPTETTPLEEQSSPSSKVDESVDCEAVSPTANESNKYEFEYDGNDNEYDIEEQDEDDEYELPF
jgi:SWI/SNF-related matrix-associated actin-dependent regulator 1 of chromatin subfamily A